MTRWDPWRGCKRYSEGCKFCYVHKGDAKRGVDTENIVKTKDFERPTERQRNGEYKLKSGLCYLCFSTDFLLEDADGWRGECWDMIKARPDVTFLFLTKRIERFAAVAPADWGDGYDNVVVCCTVENQRAADVAFDFRQCGTHFIKEGREYVLPVNQLCKQARAAGINYRPK